MDMLATQYAGERQIIEVPLKKNRTLEVTTGKVAVYSSKKIIISVEMRLIRCIIPLKKNKIRIQYATFANFGKGVMMMRKYFDCDLEKPKMPALNLCHFIQTEYEKMALYSKNEHGLLKMRGSEQIVMVFENIKTKKGTGRLYITNIGVILETKKGVTFEVPYSIITLVTESKKDMIRILWTEAKSKYSFDFQLPGKTDKNIVLSVIKDELVRWRETEGMAFLNVERKFRNLSYDELYNLENSKNPEFNAYLQEHVRHTFGYYSQGFAFLDRASILSCKLAGISPDMISHISDVEAKQRKELQVRSEAWVKTKIEIDRLQDQIDSLEKKCQNADEFKKLQKDKDYLHLKESIQKTTDSDPSFLDTQLLLDENNIASLCSYDKKSAIIYDQWCKNVSLENFTDEYDDAWIRYLLEKTNTKQGHDPIFKNSVTYDELQEALKKRDRSRTTLANFAAPENISSENVYNNCWHDTAHKMWYVQNDSLDQRLQNRADSDPDHSQSTIGRRVWGFAEDQVEMFCGLPAIKMKCKRDADKLVHVAFDRTTGHEILDMYYSVIYFLLPILEEKDVTEEIVDKRGLLTFDATEMTHVVAPDGSAKRFTPKMLKLYCDKFGLADISLGERVRRALAHIEICISFDARTPLSSDVAKKPMAKNVILRPYQNFIK